METYEKDCFDRAQQLHDSIMKQRKERVYKNDINTDIYFAVSQYMHLLYNQLQVDCPTTVISQYRQLSEHGIKLEHFTYRDCCVISALAVEPSPLKDSDIHVLLASYIQARNAILDYMVQEYPPIWKDNKVYHKVTGVSVDGESFAMSNALEVYYNI